MKPIYNALASGKAAAPSPQPPTTAEPPPQARPVHRAPPGPNAKPSKDANAGQSPAMPGDKQRIARPPAPQIASTAQPRPQEQRSGMETAMGALADKMHKPRRR